MLMRYNFLPQQHAIVVENIVFYGFVRGVVSFRMEQVDSNRICYQICYLQSDDVIFFVIETKISDSCP